MKSKMSGLALLSFSWEDMTGRICSINVKQVRMAVGLQCPWPLSREKKKQRTMDVEATKVSPPREDMVPVIVPLASGGMNRSSTGTSVPFLGLCERSVCSKAREWGCVGWWLRK